MTSEMLNRFPRAFGLLAGVTAAAAALNVGMATAAGASPHRTHGIKNATPSCGTFCANYFVETYGPGFVLKDLRARQRPGTRVILHAASNSEPGEDWAVWPAGTVRRLASFGLVSRALALHYGADQAFEVEFAPYGDGTGLCAGLATRAASGEGVTLQWCGESSRTLWVFDAASQDGSYAPLINGSDTDFSDPQVLTEPGPPTWRQSLTSFRLQTFADGTVYDDQMWDNTVGVLP
jgi:hypothetical protein